MSVFSNASRALAIAKALEALEKIDTEDVCRYVCMMYVRTHVKYP